MMKKINKVGIVGAGFMGKRIAFGCIICDKAAQLYDEDQKVLDNVIETIQKMVNQKVAEGKMTVEKAHSSLELLSISQSLQDCVVDVDCVIESVPENIEIKRQVFAEIDKSVNSDCLIATNSSSIPGSKLADATSRPEKFFNINFGTPDDKKVEVMGHPHTSSSTIEAALRLVREINLIPIHIKKEIMGYVINRMWRAVKKEVLYLLDKEYASPEDIDRGWMLEWRAPFGPCGVMDMIGLDVIRDVENMYYEASGDPSDRSPKLLDEMIAQGKLGVKSGEGFYKYPNPDYKRSGWLLDE